MTAADLKVGQSVEIQLEREGYIYHLLSKVHETGRNKVYILPITSGAKTLRFEPDDEIKLICRTRERLLAWSNVKGSVEFLEGEKYHVLHASGEAESYNRRNSYRVPYGKAHDCVQRRYEKVEAAGMMKDVLHQKFRAIVKDISESGVALIAMQTLEKGDFIEFALEDEGIQMECEARVVRCMPVEGSERKKLYGCTLTKVSREFTKFVLETQRKQLQNLRGGK